MRHRTVGNRWSFKCHSLIHCKETFCWLLLRPEDIIRAQWFWISVTHFFDPDIFPKKISLAFIRNQWEIYIQILFMTIRKPKLEEQTTYPTFSTLHLRHLKMSLYLKKKKKHQITTTIDRKQHFAVFPCLQPQKGTSEFEKYKLPWLSIWILQASCISDGPIWSTAKDFNTLDWGVQHHPDLLSPFSIMSCHSRKAKHFRNKTGHCQTHNIQ